MDRAVSNRVVDDAVREIQAHPDSVATLVTVLHRVFLEGYGYGLHQGHADELRAGGHLLSGEETGS